jgi:hypothetical protein
MQRGPKAKPAHLQVVEGNFRPDRDKMIEGELIPAPPRPKFLKGRAAKIWDAMVAEHPELTRFQFGVLETYCPLKAEHEDDPGDMPTARIVELRRQTELLLAPRGKADNGKEKANPAARFFPDAAKK